MAGSWCSSSSRSRRTSCRSTSATRTPAGASTSRPPCWRRARGTASPWDRPRPARRAHQGGWVCAKGDGALAGALRGAAADLDVTPFAVVLAAYLCHLHLMGGQSPLQVGVPAANRSLAGTEELVGCLT